MIRIKTGLERIVRLFVGGEDKVLNGIRRHFKLVLECVSLLCKMVGEISRDNVNFKEIYREIDMIETQADEVHKVLSEEIASGNFFAYLSTDFLNLIERNDDIADAAKDAAKILTETNLDQKILKFIFNESDGIEYLSSLMKTVETLSKLYDLLGSAKKEEIIRFSHNVERCEEEADSIKTRIMKKLFANAKEFNLLDVIIMRDFLNMADNIADNAEDASDIVLKIVAKGFS